jgi:hypothetical protein
MRTGVIDQPDAALGIPEGDQIFPEQPDALRLPVIDEIRRRQKGNPVQTKQISEGRALSDPDQAFIIFAREHKLSP